MIGFYITTRIKVLNFVQKCNVTKYRKKKVSNIKLLKLLTVAPKKQIRLKFSVGKGKKFYVHDLKQNKRK